MRRYMRCSPKHSVVSLLKKAILKSQGKPISNLIAMMVPQKMVHSGSKRADTAQAFASVLVFCIAAARGLPANDTVLHIIARKTSGFRPDELRFVDGWGWWATPLRVAGRCAAFPLRHHGHRHRFPWPKTAEQTADSLCSTANAET